MTGFEETVELILRSEDNERAYKLLEVLGEQFARIGKKELAQGYFHAMLAIGDVGTLNTFLERKYHTKGLIDIDSVFSILDIKQKSCLTELARKDQNIADSVIPNLHSFYWVDFVLKTSGISLQRTLNRNRQEVHCTPSIDFGPRVVLKRNNQGDSTGLELRFYDQSTEFDIPGGQHAEDIDEDPNSYYSLRHLFLDGALGETTVLDYGGLITGNDSFEQYMVESKDPSPLTEIETLRDIYNKLRSPETLEILRQTLPESDIPF